MSSYLIDNIQELNVDLQKGLYLVILGVGRIPPHIALLQNGVLHSLKVTGCNQENITEELVKYEKKKLGVLFIKLNLSINNIESYFQKYDKVSENVSCLQPIKEALNADENVHFVFDLFADLEQKKIIELKLQLNLDKVLVNNNYSFVKYTFEDINRRIEQLTD